MSLFYADLGADVNADSQSPLGAGTIGDPFNARALFDRIQDTGGTGGATDDYLVKGQAKRAFVGSSFSNFGTIKPWDPLINGPWQIGHNLSGSAVFTSGQLEGGLVATRLTGGFTDRITFQAGTYNNLFIDLVPSQAFITDNTGRIFNGCTFSGVGALFRMGNSQGLTFNNCIVNVNMVRLGTSNTVLNCNNSVFKQSKATIEALGSNSTTVNDTDCEFGFTPAVTLPVYGDVLDTDFAVDANITINGNGVYTGHEKGLFGNLRDNASESGQGEGLGASFFPPLLVGMADRDLSLGVHLGL